MLPAYNPTRGRCRCVYYRAPLFNLSSGNYSPVGAFSRWPAFRVHEREADMRKLSAEETVLLQSVKVPASIDAAIRAAAERQGITVSRATRDALALYLSHPLTKGGNAEPTPKRRARAQS